MNVGFCHKRIQSKFLEFNFTMIAKEFDANIELDFGILCCRILH